MIDLTHHALTQGLGLLLVDAQLICEALALLGPFIRHVAMLFDLSLGTLERRHGRFSFDLQLIDHHHVLRQGLLEHWYAVGIGGQVGRLELSLLGRLLKGRRLEP